MPRSTVFILVLVTFLFLTARSGADTLGLGSFDFDIDLSGGVPAPWTGTISFDNSPQNFFGTPVNMFVQVGDLTIDNTLSFLLSVDPTTPISGGFTVTARAISNPTLFTLAGDGNYVCAGAGCLTGAPDSFIGNVSTLSGSFYTSTLQSIGATYTSEGGMLCCIGNGCTPPVLATVQHCTGTFAINGFQPMNTPTSNSAVNLPLSGTFYNTLTGSFQSLSVDVTFKMGVATAGTTTLTATSNQAGTIPANFKIDLPGFQPIFFDVQSTAVGKGKITVCLHYEDDGMGHLKNTTIPESQLRLIHGPNWDPNTTQTLNTNTNTVCATVNALSPFVLAVQQLGNVPGTDADLSCEAAVEKNLGKLAGAIAKCQIRAAASAFKGKVFDEGDCEAKARAKYDKKNAKLTGCAQCVLDAQSSIADGIQSAFGTVPVQNYCDGTTPIPF